MKIEELEHDTFEDNNSASIKSSKRPKPAAPKARKFGKWRESADNWPYEEPWLHTENPMVWQGEI